MFNDCFSIQNFITNYMMTDVFDLKIYIHENVLIFCTALDANQSHIGKSHTLHILIIFHEFMFSNKLFVACKFLHVFTHKKNTDCSNLGREVFRIIVFVYKQHMMQARGGG